MQTTQPEMQDFMTWLDDLVNSDPAAKLAAAEEELFLKTLRPPEKADNPCP